MIQRILDYFEKQAFGVCDWWGDKLGLKTHYIRLFFIYLSFLTVGSSIVIYLVMAFILEHKNYIYMRRKRKSVWDI
jgi:phage shock protein PspC (stress-responsive transcriptional regulator)